MFDDFIGIRVHFSFLMSIHLVETLTHLSYINRTHYFDNQPQYRFLCFDFPIIAHNFLHTICIVVLDFRLQSNIKQLNVKQLILFIFTHAGNLDDSSINAPDFVC